MSVFYASRKSVSQRFLGIGFVIALHVAVVYLLISGLGKSIVEVVTAPIEMNVIEESVPEDAPPPPPPPPQFEAPPPEFIPPPDIQIAQDAPVANTTAIANVSAKPAPPPPPPKADVIVKPRVDPRSPNVTPPYPPSSRRAKEQGITTLQLYVSESGRVTDAKVAKSSGFQKLDAAAVEFAKRKWRYVPGTVNGKPSGMWITVGLRWKLK
jgi:protein TonB